MPVDCRNAAARAVRGAAARRARIDPASHCSGGDDGIGGSRRRRRRTRSAATRRSIPRRFTARAASRVRRYGNAAAPGRAHGPLPPPVA